MMSSVYGERLKVSIFGQSHSEGIGVVIDGLPAGITVDEAELSLFMKRRAPGGSTLSTQRKEADEVVFICGVVDGKTCGAPICAVIKNTDVRSQDYNGIADVPRPAHADFAAHCRHKGFQDVRGGGHFSGRLTAPLCVAGAVCLQFLKTRGITVGAHIYAIGDVFDTSFDMAGVNEADLNRIREKAFPVTDDNAGIKMKAVIEEVRSKADSIGGIIECAVLGVPAGTGSPMFGGIENEISAAVFGVPAVKGIEFGSGFGGTRLTGSQNNDPFYIDENTGAVKTKTNNHGGILGGIASGMPIVFKTAVKPTPSIGLPQESVSLSDNQNRILTVKGRHDPCIVHRAVPCIEAAAAVALTNIILGG